MNTVLSIDMVQSTGYKQQTAVQHNQFSTWWWLWCN